MVEGEGLDRAYFHPASKQEKKNATKEQQASKHRASDFISWKRGANLNIHTYMHSYIHTSLHEWMDGWMDGMDGINKIIARME